MLAAHQRKTRMMMRVAQIGQYLLYAEVSGSDGLTLGWTVYTHDEGEPDDVVAQFFNEERDARLFCAAPALLAACEEAHALLWHYDLTRIPIGVDWGSTEELRQKMIGQLWKAIAQARGEKDEAPHG